MSISQDQDTDFATSSSSNEAYLLDSQTKGTGAPDPKKAIGFGFALDGFSEGFALLDPDFTIIDFNGQPSRNGGRSRDQIVGRSYWDLYPENEHSELGRLFKKAMHERVPVRFENKHVKGDGQVALADVRTYPAETGGMTVFFRDITAGRDIQQRIRDLVENIDAVFYVQELDERRISYVSPAYERLWQRPAAELYADPTAFLQAVHPDDRPAVEVANSRRYEGGSTELHYRLLRTDGSIVHIRDRTFATPSPMQGSRRIVGISEDVTKETEARLLLARNAETFEAMVRNSPFGTYVVDQDFRLLLASRASEEVFAGITPLLGRDLAEILRIIWTEPFASEAISRFRHVLATGEPYRNDRTVEERQNIAATQAYDWSIDRIVLPDGNYGAVCNFYDLSERVALETQLRKVLEDKEVLVREIDHRVRNSLTTVAALLSMQGRASRSDEVEKALEVASTRIQAVARVHERLYQGERLGIVQFDEYLSQVCGDLRSSLAGEGAKLEVETVPLSMAVEHVIPLGLIANELVTNAFKHGSGDCITINVRLASAPNGYTLDFSDDGAGMPDDFAAGEGSGLGLQVVLLLAGQIGAVIEFPKPGGAAHFRLSLPAQIVVDPNDA